LLRVTKALAKLKKLGLRPLWEEDADQVARRRRRLAVGLPFSALAGIAWGVNAAPAIGTGSGLFWSLVGATAMVVFIYLEQRVVPPLAESITEGGKRGGRWGTVVWEAALIGGFILLLTRLLGVPEAPGVEMAVGFGAFYTTVVELLMDGVPGGVARLLGAGAGGPARPARTSRVDALISRGAWAEAIEDCRVAISEHPGVATPYFELVRVQIARKDYSGAVDVLDRCYRRARLTLDEEDYVVHRMSELCVSRLDDPDRAAYLISEWLDRHPDLAPPEWAERTLKDLAERSDDAEAGSHG
jgi:hypothetical protein